MASYRFKMLNQLTPVLKEIDLPTPAPVQKPLRLGIIGCGYVTTMSHLPASELVADVTVTALVDVREEFVRDLAQTHNIPIHATDHRSILDAVDAVIVAVPHHLHTSIALDFLNQGIHVLVEKPMATSQGECMQMIEAAEQSGAQLAVGMMRRFYDANRFVKRCIETDFLGKVERFEAEEAVLFENFNASPFTLLPPAGGVLLDTGPHVLDLLLWWLGDFATVNYQDDAIAGVEANCQIDILTADGIPGRVDLSRTRQLDNKIRLICEGGSLEISTLNPSQVMIESDLFAGPISAARMLDDKAARQLAPYFARQLADFAAAIQNGRTPFVSGREGMRSVALIERCKAHRQLTDPMPWARLDERIIERIAP
jgi:predicted dehydrogenase